MATSYTPLEPNLTKELTGVDVGFNTSATPSFFASTSFIYTLAFVVIIAAASFRYAYAGMLRINPSEANIKKSKEEFTRVTYGLLGVLGLWLVLFTVNKDMLTGDVTLTNLRAEVGGSSVSTNTGTVKESEVILGDDGRPVTTTTNGSETANRATLSAVGITFNKDPCVGANTSCTNLANINPKTIELLLNLKRSCTKCSVIEVTGGTEGAHSANSNHGPNKEAVDIGYTSEILSFLKLQGVNVGNDTRCNTKYKWGGFIFWDEEKDCDKSGNANSARHFHISFTGR